MFYIKHIIILPNLVFNNDLVILDNYIENYTLNMFVVIDIFLIFIY